MNGTTLPDVRERMHELADEIVARCPDAARELHALAEMTKRRRAVRHTRVKQRGFTPEEAIEVRSFAAAHPEMSEWEIGKKYGVNQGRISEALHGVRK